LHNKTQLGWVRTRATAQAGVAGALAALVPRAAYTRDPCLFVWDLVCSAVALANSEVCFYLFLFIF
jgi:hypothetical protein